MVPSFDKRRSLCQNLSVLTQAQLLSSTRVCGPESRHQSCLDLQRLGGERGQSHPPPPIPSPSILRAAQGSPPMPTLGLPHRLPRTGGRSWRWDGFPVLGLPDYLFILLPGRVLGMVRGCTVFKPYGLGGQRSHCRFPHGECSLFLHGIGSAADAQPCRPHAPPVPYICQPGQSGKAGTVHPAIHL